MTSLYVTARCYVETAVESLRARLGEERGQDLIEYAMLSGLIALALIAGALVFAPALAAMAGGISDCIDFDSVSTCAPF
jgi:Flp pilus assembly pilin Flp